MSLWIIFLTGLTTGGLSCLAVQGGLLASVIAAQKKNELGTPNVSNDARSFDTRDWLPVLIFLSTKLLAHIVLGGVLGWLGARLTLGTSLTLVLQGLAAVFMLGTAGNLLNLHPIFRYFLIQPPRWLFRAIRTTSKSEAFFAPAVLGLATIFIPCGVTQAMEVLAMNSGSIFQGAAIMGVFVLGTMPLFAGIGLATAKLSEIWNQRFLQTAAALLVILSLFTFNSVLVALDAPFTAQKLWQSVSSLGQPPSWYASTLPEVQLNEAGEQVLRLNVTNSGYVPKKLTAQAGMPVELHLITDKTYSCSLAFTLPAFGIEEMLEPSGEKIVRFTPETKGHYTYTCSMGMYSGVLEVK